MASLNQVQIIGNLGNDPDIRYTQGGTAVANISVATTEKWKDKQSGELKEQTEWHRVVFFGKLAEIVGEYLKKGASVFVQGRLQTEKWTDNNGVDRYTTKIIASDMRMLGGRRDGDSGGERSQRSGSSSQQRQTPPPDHGADFADDDIPF